MSDFERRKKKFYPKDKETSVRRTVILGKGDRDNEKEKQQNRQPEKTPVILIKTREQTTGKEDVARPQSPKKSAPDQPTGLDPEPHVLHPTKIVQNESKEKKKPQESHIQTTAPSMPHPIKLIDESHEFLSGVSEYLQDSNIGYLVVGVIGAQGVGKSTIMSILAHTHDMSNISEEILNSHIDEAYQNMGTGDNELSQSNVELRYTSEDTSLVSKSENYNAASSSSLIFKCQNVDQIERGEPCTTGIDIFVTDTRVILLDAGPSGGYGLSRMGGTGVPTPGSRGPVGGSGLEAAAFLLAVCHVVILIQDWFTDVNMLRFIQSAEMVKPAIPTTSNPSSGPSHSSALSNTSELGDSQVHREYYPHLLFLHNKCNAEDFKPSSIRMMQDLYRKAFCKSKMHIDSGIFMYEPDSTDDTPSIDGLFHNLNASRCGNPVNLFLMPLVEEETEKTDTYNGHPTMEELANKLRWQIFGINRNQLTNVQLTEKNWLQYCSKAWENIRKSTFFIEYNRLLP